MDKKAQLDLEVFLSPMFILLAGGSIIALVLGFVFGKQMGFESFSIWQLGITLIVCILASYFFAARDL